MVFIILFLIWAIPAYINYRYIQLRYYHPKGAWFNLDEKGNSTDLFVTFCPFINLLVMIMLFGIGWKDSTYQKKTKNFFEPRKPFK